MLCDCGEVVVKSCKKTVLSYFGLETRKALLLRKDGVRWLGHLVLSKKTSSLEATASRSRSNIQVIVHEKKVSICGKEDEAEVYA